MCTAFGCEEMPVPKSSVEYEDMISQDGKFVSPRQIRAVTGE
jgi:hypothetical protein